MSYIRCLSNPEGLYAWSDGKTTYLWHNVPKPLSRGKKERGRDGISMEVPTRIFEAGLKKWAKGQEKSTTKGFTIEEQYIYTKTGKQVPERHLTMWLRDKKEKGYRVKLSYGGHFVFLWRVTMDYMARRFDA